jgi:hypothetical protein
MRMLHKCESKVYGPKEAKAHPHSVDPSLCERGWREATEREQWEAENYVPAGKDEPNGTVPRG